MKHRILGRTGLSLSELGMGCEGFEGKTPQEVAQLLDAAMEAGINCFDLYTPNPAVREALGQALGRYPRDSYVLQAHLCTVWQDGQYSRTRRIDEVKASVEELFRLMKPGHLDIGMIHYVDQESDLDEVIHGPVMAYLRELQQAGRVRSTGLSTHNPDVALRAVEWGGFDVIMMSVNPAYDMLPASDDVDLLFEESTFDRVYEGIDPKREQMYRACQNAGVGITVMKPFAGGLLLDEKQSPFGRAMTPAQCIAYCLDRPAVASVLGGMKTVEEIREAARFAAVPAGERDYSAILAGAPKRSFHGHCMYCGHCAPCAVKIDIASVNRYLDLAQAQGFVPETVRDHYDLLEHHAGECIACGRCVKNCPFGTDVIGKMRQAAALFGK